VSGDHRENERGPGAIDQYKQHFNLHIAPFIGDTKLPDLTIPTVRSWQDRLRKADRSSTMVKRVTVSLGSILADAQERGHVGRNVVREMKRHRRRGKEGQGEQRQKARLRIGVDIPAPAEIRAIIADASGR
jgi:hypothetical protein